MNIVLQSFGRKHRVAPPACATFDVRHCRNPWTVQKLRKLTGQDEEVQDYVLGDKVGAETLDAILAYVCSVVRNTSASRIVFSICCHGGRHRSVAFVERLAAALEHLTARSESRNEITVEHVELD